MAETDLAAESEAEIAAAATPTVAQAYGALIRSRVSAQTIYRGSFAFEVVGQFGIGFIDFAEIYVVFHQVRSLGGFSFPEVALMFGLATCAFAIADILVGHVENLPTYVRTGTFDAMLLRPLSALGQLVTSDFSLRRAGRCLAGLGVLAVALSYAHIEWTPARLALLAVTPLAGTVIFSSVFVATSAVSFWLVEGTEFANAFTYGGNHLSSLPFTVFDVTVRRFFTFVVPAAFVSYLPTLALLGRPDPTGLPSWLSWSGPVAALAAAAAAGLVWRTGLRHYAGAGS
ncbi:MAG: ABC transporter permease [Actinomycetes bacterium]